MSSTRKARSSKLIAAAPAAGQPPESNLPGSLRATGQAIAGDLRKAWNLLRRVTGDDAYERYVQHWQEKHPDEGAPMSRQAFQAAEINRRWNKIRRCC